MLDKSIGYVPFCMLRKSGTIVPSAPLHEGYYIRFYQDGDGDNWAEIESSVNEFDSKDKALDYFAKDFAPYKEKLYDRNMYLCTDDGEAIGTFTAWYGTHIDGVDMPCVHWVAIKPGYQGLGLGKSLVSYGVSHMIELDGDVDFYLCTQTWSYKAVGIYKWAGFNLYNGTVQDRENKYHEAITILDSLARSPGKEI